MRTQRLILTLIACGVAAVTSITLSSGQTPVGPSWWPRKVSLSLTFHQTEPLALACGPTDIRPGDFLGLPFAVAAPLLRLAVACSLKAG